MDVIIEQTGSALGVIPLRQKPSNLSCGSRAESQTGSYGHPLYLELFYSPSLLKLVEQLTFFSAFGNC